MDKGGSSTTSTSIDPQIKAQFLTNLQQAQGVAGALPTQQFAGFNPLYQAGEEQLVNTSLAGPGYANIDLAAQLAGQGGQFTPASVTGAQANLGLTGTGSIGSYMNPYLESVRKNALADLETARQSAIQQTGEQATRAKAFGGTRQGVAEGITNAGFAKQAANIGATLNQQGYDAAAMMQQQDLARQQQAALANQQAGLSGAGLNLTAAGSLGNLASIQQALRTGGAQAVMGAGQARQALTQQQMDAIRNIGQQKLGITSGALGLQPANIGGTSTSPYYTNPLATGAGVALAGSQALKNLGMISAAPAIASTAAATPALSEMALFAMGL